MDQDSAPRHLFPDGASTRRILKLGLPIMGGMSTYVLLELIDMVFVGMLGTVAVAAVGISVFLTFSWLALFGGATIAVQATTARLVGERVTNDLSRFLRTTLVLIVALAPPGAFVAGWFAQPLLDLMSEDPEVPLAGTAYLQWSFAAGIFLTLNNAFMGYWNATDRPGLYFRVVLVQAAIKLPLNALLMFGAFGTPGFGVTGAGISTCAAALAGTVFHMVMASKHAGPYWRGEFTPHVPVIVRLLLPAGVQQFLENLALTLMFRIVAMLGTVEVAAYTILINLINTVGIPAWALGAAGATLVGQALGEKNPDAAHRAAWDVIKVGTLCMLILGIPLWAAPEAILRIFLHDPVAIDTAIGPCRLLGAMIGINGIGYLFANLLYGAGDVKRVMYVNLATQYLLLLPGAWAMAAWSTWGLFGVLFIHQVAFRAVNAAILTALWQQRRWADVKLW
jgi:putative MATE family efflux protein